MYKIICLISICYLLGLILFVNNIPTKNQQSVYDVDAVVALTGDKNRIVKIKNLLQADYYKLYFISGVGAPEYLKKYFSR